MNVSVVFNLISLADFNIVMEVYHVIVPVFAVSISH